MFFTKRSDYGLRAALELAAGFGCGPLSAHQIAAGAGLPEPFVRKLLQDLAVAGLATSQRGRAGGYLLARAPAGVTVCETLEAFETLAPVPCLAAHPDGTGAVAEQRAFDTQASGARGESAFQPNAAGDLEDLATDGVAGVDAGGDAELCAIEVPEFRCPTRAAWNVVDAHVRAALQSLTLADLLDEVHGRGLQGEMLHAR